MQAYLANPEDYETNRDLGLKMIGTSALILPAEKHVLKALSFDRAGAEREPLLHALAKQGARVRWRDMGCPDEASAIGCLAWLLRRRWGLTALRENARLKLDRLAFVGRGAAQAADRRQRSELAHAVRSRLFLAQRGFTRRRH